MSTIRDGHVLGGVFADMLRWLVNEYGEAAANDINQIYGLYSDQEAFETRLVDVYGAMWASPVRVGVRFSFDYTFDDHPPWIVIVPFARVDGQWKITYTGFCRYMERLSGPGLECPPDPRPDIAASTGEHADSGYDAADDPNRQAISRNNEIGW
ncbi:MAG: hypothetical protein J4G11_08520 [Acidimicrobiia bacterium]|nr:hypothetical protein [Acidimicrobiia bacterium]